LFQLFTQAFILVRRKKLFGIPVAFNWVMFDIFMAHADGRAEHLMSVGYLTQAQEMARQLSYLTPESISVISSAANVGPILSRRSEAE
jgi:hypothetical protein